MSRTPLEPLIDNEMISSVHVVGNIPVRFCINNTTKKPMWTKSNPSRACDSHALTEAMRLRLTSNAYPMSRIDAIAADACSAATFGVNGARSLTAC